VEWGCKHDQGRETREGSRSTIANNSFTATAGVPPLPGRQKHKSGLALKGAEAAFFVFLFELAGEELAGVRSWGGGRLAGRLGALVSKGFQLETLSLQVTTGQSGAGSSRFKGHHESLTFTSILIFLGVGGAKALLL
jgi:hypothetical protein